MLRWEKRIAGQAVMGDEERAAKRPSGQFSPKKDVGGWAEKDVGGWDECN